LKILKPRILLLLGLLTIGIAYSIKKSPEGMIPYPYKFRFQNAAVTANAPAQNAHVLLIGDSMGKSLFRYKESLQEKLTKEMNLNTPIRIESLANDHIGPHRLITQLKSIKKLPPVIIYFAGADMYYEKTFLIKEAPSILDNIKRFKNEMAQTWVMGLPFVKNLLYVPMKRITISDKIVQDTFPYKDKDRPTLIEITLKLFELQIEELTKYVLNQRSHLIVITTPYNLEILPKKICQQTTSPEILSFQNHVYAILQTGDYKKAFNEADELLRLSPGNALSAYLKGKAAQFLSDKEKSIENFRLSALFDCSLWRGHHGFNQVLRKLPDHYEISLIDFDDMILNYWGKNVLFINDTVPQDVYFQELIDQLIPPIKSALNI
jgi:hypothetical protein